MQYNSYKEIIISYNEKTIKKVKTMAEKKKRNYAVDF